MGWSRVGLGWIGVELHLGWSRIGLAWSRAARPVLGQIGLDSIRLGFGVELGWMGLGGREAAEFN